MAGGRSIKVSSVVQPRISPPVVATAPGISVSQDAVFNSYSRRPAKRPRYRSDDLLLHSASHRTLDYTAREDKPKDGQPLLKHYIGLLDPTTGQLQLAEAKKMIVRGAVRAQQASEEEMQPQLSSQSMYDQRTELGQAFGTKKAKKALAAVVENAINPHKSKISDGAQILDASEKALMASMKDVAMSVPTHEDLQSAIDAGKPVPRGNLEADEIQDVYKPEELIGRDVLELIQVNDWMQAVKKNEDVKLRSRFVANRLRRIGSGENAVARLRLLRYTYFLLVVLMTSRKGRDKGAREILKKDKLQEELAPAQPPVIESIRRKFTEGGVMRKPHVDLLTTHLCAFACILDNYDTNTWDLKEDLKLEQKEMNQFFMEIGARINKRKVEEGRTDCFGVLKLPLVFPKMRRGRR
ncbi:hypothetical protein M406DRAFT_325125 [Cryphonectria parasitica EP155]|uniref:Uncharacterized protein n=1 Tax=Cryphonectria parasitica (strain ATCC 38755 / EP155) TaxID=660469 RepID=A0A9P4YA52_CRYP1|nr:uncharacterized protein M406DRAFT_325125 [Cryphonectria parasitica EP155]KAF3769633.1 hypothetical protein M406DRAFT_325125 [Cryphonectria parasitica EP155]